MAALQQGRLLRVPRRGVWRPESGGFTPWLAQEASLRLLGCGLHKAHDRRSIVVPAPLGAVDYQRCPE